MNRRARLLARRSLAVLTAGVGAAAAVSLAGCGSSAVTRPRLERDLPRVFSNLYVQQAAILGHRGITVASLHARAMCDKHGPKVPDRGPGGDWTCLMSWTDPNVTLPDGWGKFELNVHSNACYTATGPTKLVGFLTISDRQGRDVTNPVFEFDGCFDPNGDNSPTGVIFPAALSFGTDPLRPKANGRVTPKITCSLGDKGCSGTVTARVNGVTIGTASYNLEPGRATTLAFTLPGRPTASNLALTAVAGTGTTPTKPTTVAIAAG